MTTPASSYTTVVEIVQKDYASLSAIIGRIETYRDVLRNATLTLWSAAIGLAVANDNEIPVIGAAILIPTLGWTDLRLDFQYHVAHARSQKLELIVQSYVAWVLEIDQPFEDHARERLDDHLTQYSYGSAFNLTSPDGRMVFAHVKNVHRWPVLYLLLEITLVVACYILRP